MTIRKAVIPAAGFGTRFLPISKAVPKEMLPVVDKPVIQYVVEEAVASGITDILLIISRGKRAIEEHFIANPELEADLEAKGKTEPLEELRKLQSLARIHFVFQPKMGGLGDAIRCAREHVNGEPFAVLLGDALVSNSEGAKPVLRQLMDVHEKHGGSVVALEEVPQEKVSRYGIMGGAEVESGVIRADKFVEKPKPEEAPSRLAVSARYILSASIFDELEKTKPGKGGEIQLTDAMAALMQREPLFGVKYQGRRHDIGNKLDFVKANLWWGLRRPDMAEQLRAYISELE
jgi:UTP--glucose-1-phosphate uridylyltransferase